MSTTKAPPVKQIDHVNFSVRDFDESAAWYKRVLGFEVVERGTYKGQPWGVIRNGDSAFCIYQRPEWSLRPTDDSKTIGVQRVAHIALRYTDADALEAHLKNEGVEIGYGGVVHWPHSRSWYVVDPNLYELELVVWNSDEMSFEGVPVG